MHFVNKIRDKAIYLFRNRYEKYYFNSCQKKNKNTDFSLFSPNCFAGIIYHRLGLEFKSPTINMLFPIKKQYLKFVLILNTIWNYLWFLLRISIIIVR